MSANYTSNKPDGYMSKRNEIYQKREQDAQAALRAQMEKDKVPAPMNHENYGYKKAR